MNHVHFFQWNIPADNHYCGRTDGYINVIAEWDSNSFYHNDKPMFFVELANPSFYDCIKVKDWEQAFNQIKAVAAKHFSEIAKAERIAQARATLLSEGEPTGVPTLDLYTEKMHDLIVQENLS